MANKWDGLIEDLVKQSYSIQPDWFEPDLASDLLKSAKQLEFKTAGIGQGSQHHVQNQIRSNNICWLNAEASPAESLFLAKMDEFRLILNQAFYLSLHEYEAQFGHYPIGSFYKKHLDQFNNQNNRKISTVYYINEDWGDYDGGELLMYNKQNQLLTRVLPKSNTLVCFLSDQIPHEVLTAKRERWSVAGWFRTRSTTI